MDTDSDDVDWGARAGVRRVAVEPVAPLADVSANSDSDLDWGAAANRAAPAPSTSPQHNPQQPHNNSARKTVNRLNKYTRQEQAQRASDAARVARMERQIQRLEDEKKTREACEAKRSEADMCCNIAFKGSNFTEFGRRYGKSRTWVKASRSKTDNGWLEGREVVLELH